MSGEQIYASRDRALLALGLRLGAAAFLSLMSAMVRLADARGVSFVETLFYRNLFALPLLFGWVVLGPGVASLQTARPGAHVSRGAVGLLGMTLWFTAYRLLPLAEATTIGFTVPMFATIAAVLVLRERVGVHRWGAVAVGFIGILIIAKPGAVAVPVLGALAGLGSAVMTSVVSILIRQLSRTEQATTIAFWFAAFGAGVTVVFMPFAARGHDAATWGILLILGFSGAAGQLALTASLRFAAVSTVVAMDYSSLIWATLLGWLLFAQWPSSATWFGAPLVIGSGLYIAWREHRRQI